MIILIGMKYSEIWLPLFHPELLVADVWSVWWNSEGGVVREPRDFGWTPGTFPAWQWLPVHKGQSLEFTTSWLWLWPVTHLSKVWPIISLVTSATRAVCQCDATEGGQWPDLVPSSPKQQVSKSTFSPSCQLLFLRTSQLSVFGLDNWPLAFVLASLEIFGGSRSQAARAPLWSCWGRKRRGPEAVFTFHNWRPLAFLGTVFSQVLIHDFTPLQYERAIVVKSSFALTLLTSSFALTLLTSSFALTLLSNIPSTRSSTLAYMAVCGGFLLCLLYLLHWYWFLHLLFR